MQKTNFKFEVLINDDASTDGTKEIIEEYAQKYPDIIKPVFQKENQFSQGIRDMCGKFLLPLARSEYIALCEGDDFFTDENKLQLQADFLDNNPEYSLCFHPVRVFYENSNQKEYIFPRKKDPSRFTLKRLLKSNFIQTNSVMYRKQDYSGFPKDILPVDWYLHLYHAQFGKIGFINKVMSTYRRHEGGIWWDSNVNKEKHYKKHGVANLACYFEILKLYGEKEEYRNIILGHIKSMLGILIDIDKRDNENLYEESLAQISNETLKSIIYYETKILYKINEKKKRFSRTLKQMRRAIRRTSRITADFFYKLFRLR